MRALLAITTSIWVPVWVSVWALAGCTEPRSPECKEVCKREAECIDSTGSKLPFDEKECIAACAALEHDVQHSGAKVRRHIDCVKNQPSCLAVLECK